MATRQALLTTTLLLIWIASLPAQQPSRPSPGAMRDFSNMLQDLVERVDPAVVQILTRDFAVSDEGGVALIRPGRGSGSGAVVDPAGYIITNAHVVGTARQVQVLLPEKAEEQARYSSVIKPSGRLLPAKIVGMDRETDIAVLKVEAQALPHLSFGDSEAIRQGQVVVAFGSPFGLENSVTMGIVSSVARQVHADDPMIYIQTDAAINPGNSGGPLVNSAGHIVGLNTFIYSPSGANDGVGFAVPSNIARTAYEQIRKDGRVRRGQVGVVAQTITPGLALALSLPQSWGVILSDVTPKGSAEAAGLEPGDVVLALDGKPMENARQFGVNIYQRAGATVTMDLMRNGVKMTKRVAVLERPRDPDRILAHLEGEENIIPRLGLLGVDLDADVLPLLPPLRRFQGVVVAGVIADFAADENSLRPGDVIYELNQQKVVNVESLRALSGALERGKPAALLVERLGQLQFLLLDLP